MKTTMMIEYGAIIVAITHTSRQPARGVCLKISTSMTTMEMYTSYAQEMGT